MTALEIAMDKARLQQAALTKLVECAYDNGMALFVNASEGLAAVFEDTPLSKPVAIVTVAFARKFCAEDPYYTWRKL